MEEVILIATMGKTPGAVTTSMDLLAERGLAATTVITLMTPFHLKSADTAIAYEPRVDANELHNQDAKRIPRDYYTYVAQEVASSYYFEDRGFPRKVDLRPYVLNIPHSDLSDDMEALDFFRLCLREMLKYDPEQDGAAVYVGIAGGRKAMAAMAMLAATMTGWGGNVFQAVVTEKVEEAWRALCEAGARISAQMVRDALHPGSDDAWYLGVPVKLPPPLQRALRARAGTVLKNPISFVKGKRRVDYDALYEGLGEVDA